MAALPFNTKSEPGRDHTQAGVVAAPPPRSDRDDPRFSIGTKVYRELYAFARRELRRMAREDTLDTTALVNEAWLRLAHGAARWASREHFIATMARVMRHVLIDHVRRKRAGRHGGDAIQITLTGLDPGAAGASDPFDLLAVDAALCRLREVDPRLEQIAELRFFGGLSVEETARALGLSSATIKRESRSARALLALELGT